MRPRETGHEVIAFLALLLAALTGSAVADEIDEIMVEVRKRSEAVQDVPLAVSVFDRQSVELDRIDSLPDLALRTPGLTFSDPFGRLNPAPGFRGLVQPGIGDEPNVGVFIDGIYVSGRIGTNFLSADLERVEIARGPQSALYGRNSFGGAINFQTRRPSGKPAAEAEVTIADHGFREIEAGIETPLVADVLAARLMVLDHDSGTDVDNAIPGEAPDIGLIRNIQGILGLSYTPSERVEGYLRLAWSRDNDGQPKSYVVPANGGERLSDGALRYFVGTVPGPPDSYAANADHFGYTRRTLRVSSVWDWALSDDLTVSSLTGVSDTDAEFGFDGDHSPVRAYHQGQIIRSWDLSQEVRVLHQGSRLTWLAGGNYYRFEQDTVRQDQFLIFNQPERGGPITESLTEAGAIYGSLDYRLADNLRAVAELRYQIEYKRFQSSSTDAAGNPLDLSDRWHSWLPRLALDAALNDRVTLYGSVARGFKSGGFNDDTNLFDDQRSFDPDSNWTFEAGAKTRWLDGRLTANLTGFWILWDGQQLVAASSAGLTDNFFNTNVGESRSRGIELELAARPTDWLSLDLSYAFTDARFVDYQDPDLVDIAGFAPDGDVSGNRLPRYAPHQLAVGTLLEFPVLQDRATALFRAEGLYQSSQFSTPANLARSGGLSRINLRAEIESRYADLALFVNNLADDQSASVAIRWFDPTAGFGRAWLITPQESRRFGAELTLRWP